MTDDPTELHDLASAYLDDEVSAEERVRVESDPELLARVEELRRVAAAVGRPVPPLDDAEAAAQRRRARVAGAEEAPRGRPAPPPVRRRLTWLPSPAAAAAIIVVIALVGVLLIAGGRSSDDADTAAAAGGSSTTGAAADPEETDRLQPQAAEGGASADLTDLGSFATRADLTRALDAVDVTTLARAQTSTAPSTTTQATTADRASAEVARCEQTVQAQGDLDARLAVATARLAGAPVLVFSHPVTGDEGEPVTQLSVVDADDCRVLFAIQR